MAAPGLREKILDKYTSTDLVELIDIPIEDLVDLLWDVLTEDYFHIILEDLGETIED